MLLKRSWLDSEGDSFDVGVEVKCDQGRAMVKDSRVTTTIDQTGDQVCVWSKAQTANSPQH